MKLKIICLNCKNEITTVFHASDRSRLSAKIGNETVVTCSNCGDQRKYQVKSIYAQESPIVFLITFITSLAIAVFIAILASRYEIHGIYAVGISAAIPLLIFTIVVAIQKQKLNRFNSSSVDSK